MTIQDFGDADLRKIAAMPGAARLLSGKCDHCGRPYRARPCADSDHYRTSIDLAIEADSKPWVSFGCQHPTEQQAPILPVHQRRRHPYSGKRSDWSGYCVIDTCACECHQNEALDEIEDVI
jgi:hypothetical protein